MRPRPRGEHGNRIVLALGSNLGDRVHHLLGAVGRLADAGLAPDSFSSIYETPPVGFAGQPDFLNAVVALTSGLPPKDVLSIFQAVEEGAGRVRAFRNGPRTLDLDLVFYGDRIVRTEGLILPHPRWKERSFVVRPMLEVVPDFRDPETGLRVREVAALWPAEPAEIRVRCDAQAFRKTFEEWQR